MYKTYITASALTSLDRYISLYEDYIIKPFYDTGMDHGIESIIQSQYHGKADELFLSLYDHMMSRISDDTVLWRKIHPENPGQFTLITPIEDRTLIIEYREDGENMSRTIIELRIFRE